MTTSQFFVYRRPIAWTILIATIAWGALAYKSMPQRQDPLIQIRSGVVLTNYPGANAIEVEQELSRKIEKKLSENPAVEHVRSLSRQGLSVVFVDLYDTTKNAEAVWQDLDNKLAGMTNLPSVGEFTLRPRLDKDFGDTVAVMLTISSPPISNWEVEQRATVIRRRLSDIRAAVPSEAREQRCSAVLVHPASIDQEFLQRMATSLSERLREKNLIQQSQTVFLLGASAIDFQLSANVDEARVRREIQLWEGETLGEGIGHPDIWPGVLVGSLVELEETLKTHCQQQPGGVARYTYAEMHRFADLIQDRLKQSPKIGKIEQHGVVDEAVYLYLSGHRIGSANVTMQGLAQELAKRNIDVPGGNIDVSRQSLTVKPSGKLVGSEELHDMVITSHEGRLNYLGNLVEIVRGYEDPPRSLNFRTVKVPADQSPAELPTPDSTGHAAKSHGHGHQQPHDADSTPLQVWTTRAITLAVRHVKGTQISDFSREVDAKLGSLKGVLPDDLRIERTSDEPDRVVHKINEFMDCLIEAIVIVIVVALVLMEWRSALLVALSIPLTLAMTFGFCALLGIDLQQISIAALIIALGLLVDDPVVAGDAINREIAHGASRDVAAWLGPQKLSRAILYATITNCVAFLPLLLVSGGVGEFIYSLPVVVTASLVASRIVSMTLIPLLGYYMLRGQAGMEAGGAEGGQGNWFTRAYNGFSELCMEHKWTSLSCCIVILMAAVSLLPRIGSSFFPKDLHTAFTVDLFLPEDSSIQQTCQEAHRAIAKIEAILGNDVQAYTTFVGAGGPRFWLSSVPEQPASNYAQIMVHTHDRHRTGEISDRLKRELPWQIASARVRVNQLESGPPIGIPVQFRILGHDVAVIRRLGDELKGYMREFPGTIDIQDDWDPETFQLALSVNSERANLIGIRNEDVASATYGALSGLTTTYLHERDQLIPVVLRLRPDERSKLEIIDTLNIAIPNTNQFVPLDQLATFRPQAVTPKIARRDNERCLTVKCDTVPGVLPSKAVEFLESKLNAASWPAGYHFQVGGEKEEQSKGFATMSIAMVTSIVAIYIALVMQFNDFIKPLVVFAAVPFGMVGGLMGLLFFNVPLGFFALLGLSSLAGVIISHVIVLFEYIEEAHERGEPLRRAVIDSALVRLRPVLVTVLATVGGLIPLALKGGPLWEPLCYVQIVGLLVATLVTKVLVPVLYVLFVENFKLISWSAPGEHRIEGPPAQYTVSKH